MSEIPNPTPEYFRYIYTKSYKKIDSDSPDISRSFLIEKIIHRSLALLDDPVFTRENSEVNILSLAAGRQRLENEMFSCPNWDSISGRVNLFTLDIAQIKPEQLMFNRYRHIEANAVKLPIMNSGIDIVDSNMALDYMPREVFAEISRVLKPSGVLMANLHHPDLLHGIQSELLSAKKKTRTANQKIVHGQGSRKIGIYRQNLDQALHDYEIVLFKLEKAHSLIFHSAEELEQYIRSNFSCSSLSVEECTNIPDSNGWFYLEASGLSMKKSC